MQAAVVGAGVVGRMALEVLAARPEVDRLVAVRRTATRAGIDGDIEVVTDLPDGLDVVIITAPGDVRRWATAALSRGAHVVSTADDPRPAQALLGLHTEAIERHRHVVAGAGMAPGLGCVLARWAATRLDVVDEVHVASAGTAGPACARAHHAALSSIAVDYHDGRWRRRPGGAGRELVWFPEPVGGADCYRCDRADPLLLVPAFPGVRRVTARVAATRRDRTTAWLPMLYPPHPEGLVGAVRAAVRGWADGQARTEIVGAGVRPGLAAGTVAATAAVWAATGRLARTGAGGLAEMVDDPAAYLVDLAERGVRPAVFEGAAAALAPSGSPMAASARQR